MNMPKKRTVLFSIPTKDGSYTSFMCVATSMLDAAKQCKAFCDAHSNDLSKSIDSIEVFEAINKKKVDEHSKTYKPYDESSVDNDKYNDTIYNVAQKMTLLYNVVLPEIKLEDLIDYQTPDENERLAAADEWSICLDSPYA